MRGVAVTVSLRRMSLGAGFEYLMGSVARGDGAGLLSGPLTAYYAASGTPAGRFLGRGLTGLDDGRGVEVGSVVSEQALWRLLGMMCDPVTGEPLGARSKRWPHSVGRRVGERIAGLPESLTAGDRVDAVAAIEVEEVERKVTRPVAAFDLTFSVPKSVSTVWAVAGPAVQAEIYAAHHAAIDTALAWAEQHIVFTRTGACGATQTQVRGVVAAAFDHWDSRAGDPHLHTHVVVANRVQTVDGTWRTLDGATLYRYAVALSELHEGVLQDELTARLGVAWSERARRHSAVPRWDITGIPGSLLEEFSTRSQQIEASKNDLITAFAAAHGRHPTNVEILKLRQQATLATRPDKTAHLLGEQMQDWRERALPHLPQEVGAGSGTVPWAQSLLQANPLPTLSADTAPAELLGEIASVALATVAEKRAVFGPANVLAEVHRQLHGTRFASPLDRLAVADRITAAALEQAVYLGPHAVSEGVGNAAEQVTVVPSRRVHAGAQQYTIQATLDAEARLLTAADDATAPATTVTATATAGRDLDPAQAAAVTAIAGSGRRLDLLVGPAGSGKTATLAALRQGWEATFGPGSVTGLAPSAAAAQVLADELGIPADNTAKWLHEHRHAHDRAARIADLARRMTTLTPGTGRYLDTTRQLRQANAERRRWDITPGQLVIIDEAGLAGTLHLDAIVTAANESNAKVLLVGDWAQLGSVHAGGAFTMLVNQRPDTPELDTLHRFEREWERDATLALRRGDTSVYDAYLEHDRIRAGDTSVVLDAVHAAWAADTAAGLQSVMIAGDNTTARDLNLRARTHLIQTGRVSTEGVPLGDGTAAGTGDLIVTRHNDRTLATSSGGWVRNGDTWTVNQTHPDGSITATDPRGSSVHLNPGYVATHVELGYATTAHRTQGRTTDTAHALITAASTREQLYVATTRGRAANTLYLDTTSAGGDPDTSHSNETLDPQQLFGDVVRHSENQQTATDTARQHHTLIQLANTALTPQHAAGRSLTHPLHELTPTEAPRQHAL